MLYLEMYIIYLLLLAHIGHQHHHHPPSSCCFSPSSLMMMVPPPNPNKRRPLSPVKLEQPTRFSIVNARYSRMLELGKALFERTGLVVYTIGLTNNPKAPPALTCQARHQEAEIFGEFPPRMTLGTYTKYPPTWWLARNIGVNLKNGCNIILKK